MDLGDTLVLCVHPNVYAEKGCGTEGQRSGGGGEGRLGVGYIQWMEIENAADNSSQVGVGRTEKIKYIYNIVIVCNGFVPRPGQCHSETVDQTPIHPYVSPGCWV